jgi:hypothetical protein
MAFSTSTAIENRKARRPIADTKLILLDVGRLLKTSRSGGGKADAEGRRESASILGQTHSQNHDTLQICTYDGSIN